MDINYVADAERTEKRFSDGIVLSQHDIESLHAAMGLATEGNEVLNLFKRKVIYGKDIEALEVIMELGDLMWFYSQMLRKLSDSMGLTPIEIHELVLKTNISKLKSRYPQKYEDSLAIKRDTNLEKMASSDAFLCDAGNPDDF